MSDCLTRKVLIEKTIPEFLLIEFNKRRHTDRVYVDNFDMPASFYVFDEPPADANGLDIRRLVATSEIEKRKNGYYAINIKPVKNTLGEEYIKMLHKGQIAIYPSGTGTVNQNDTVENYTPICLYFHFI